MESSVQQYYARNRDKITDGCLFLISKNRFLSKRIRWADSRNPNDIAEYSHVGELWIKPIGSRRRVLTLESNQDGLKEHLFSDVLKVCDKLLILKPICSQAVIDNELWDSFERAAKGVKYDFFNGAKEFVNRGFGTDLKITGNPSVAICSKSVRIKYQRQFMVDTNLILNNKKFEDLSLPFPQDYIRYLNPLTTEILK